MTSGRSGDSRVVRSADLPVGAGVARDRNGRPVVGAAAIRTGTTPGRDVVYIPIVQSWSPWYSAGFGWNANYFYNPWGYGSRWGRYGMWYDPWGYDPWGYYPYDPYYTGSYSRRGYSDVDPEPAAPRRYVGSLRLKANVSDAKVYVDGTLMGTVDDFNGLMNHLELDAGGHQLELRADGYQPLTKDVFVKAGKTLTERVSLKKK